ncbi:MAG: SBBP repeat-containing protein [Acidobacteria bacterium]|nr:SBBP repeat-containing protein [Acidobacteriota bacterium]
MYSTYLGGESSDAGLGIAINSNGNAYVTGGTSSSNFPTANALQPVKAGLPESADAFVAWLNPEGSALEYSTYLGGGGNDGGTGIAVDPSGNAYVIGTTDSPNFPNTNSLQTALRGELDAFLFKILNDTPAAPTLFPNAVVNGVSFQPATEPGSAIAPGSIVSIFGADLAASTQGASLLPLPTQLGETSVVFTPGGPAPLFVVSGGEIIAQVPFEVPVGPAPVQVRRGSASSASQNVMVVAAAPNIFTINQQGTGQGVIVIANTALLAAPAGSIPGRESRAVNRGEFISIFCTGLGDVTNRPPNGAAGSGDQSVTLLTPTVTIGGNPTPPSFSGLSSYVGLYRVDVQVPPSALVGDAIDVKISMAEVPSNTATIAIQ